MYTKYNPPQHTGLAVLYQDDHLLALNKPAGLLSVPGKGDDKQDCLESRVRNEYTDALIVHRLDMSTSGILLMARSKEIQSHLSRLFQQREIHKKYIAVISGKPTPSSGEIDLPLITDWPNRPLQIVDFVRGKHAITRYAVLEYSKKNQSSRVELTPITGRSHQLRVHLKAIGHPILGDELYADPATFNKASRLLLHASELSFNHPVNGTLLKINSEPEF